MTDINTSRIPDPATKIGVLRRYLHVLALLQNYQDREEWNATNLAELLNIEEGGSSVSDKSVRDYIRKNLMEELGIPVTKVQGGHRTIIDEALDAEVLARVANIYASFVIADTTRDIILKNLIQRHPVDCLWLLARYHFAIMKKQGIRIDYTNNSGEKLADLVLFPWHLVMRNNNLYLVAYRHGHEKPWLLIVNRITNLRVIDEHFVGAIPPLDEIFPDTLGGFIGAQYSVCIRYGEDMHPKMEQVLSILEPDIHKLDDGRREARFSVADGQYLCKQLFLYGRNVEIVEPPELRDMMIGMLRESLAAYEP